MNDIDHARPVLVTGGSGFIAGHVILRLLAQGRRVRTTVRSLGRQDAVRAVLGDAGAEHLDLLEFVAADLTRDDGWDLAVDGSTVSCTWPRRCVRGTSTTRTTSSSRPDGDAPGARCRACRRVRRVVLTSAFHAVGFGHGRVDRVFTEEDWSPLDGPGMDAYGRSKVLAERAAWEFAGETGSPELVTILPVAVLGPVMGDAVSGTNHLLQRMLNGGCPGSPTSRSRSSTCATSPLRTLPRWTSRQQRGSACCSRRRRPPPRSATWAHCSVRRSASGPRRSRPGTSRRSSSAPPHRSGRSSVTWCRSWGT
ncbi:NAD-dependent epimerase/dehydratase family protein [Curtobacterium flaccumfaciens]|nr:NAD-dependent epimerase/dehydratase family protein [Curtobacterium flaccumfaciens]